jgi:hypothetical protein
VHRLAAIGPAEGHYEIQSVDISMTGSTVPVGMAGGFRVQFYTAEPLPAADNAAFSADTTERLIHIGYIDVGTLELFGSGFLRAFNNTSRIRFQSITTDVWIKIVTLTGNGFTPVSEAQFQITVRGIQLGVPSPTAGAANWLANNVYRQAEQLPLVSWEFAKNRSLIDSIRRLTLPYTCTTSRTFEQADTTWGTVGINEPAFSYRNGASAGLDLYAGRTYLPLNSAAPATQDVTVTAAAHTLSFRGTGSITLTGVSTAGPLNGTGANDRVELRFTPTAGTLTLTLSGDVREPQLELGVGASPYRPTQALRVTTGATVCQLPDLSSWYEPGGVWYVEAIAGPIPSGGFPRFFELHDGTASNIITLQRFSTGIVRADITTAGVSQAGLNNGTVAEGTLVKAAFRVVTDDIGLSANGAAVTTDTSAILPVVTALRLGSTRNNTNYLNSTIARLDYYGPGAATAFLQRMTA